jgi:pyruvate kinase
MDAARLNFSHGSRSEHAESLRLVRRASEIVGRELAVIADLQGPKIRTGALASGPVRLRDGDEFVLSSRPRAGDGRGVSVSHPALIGEISRGQRVLLADGALELEVLRVGRGEAVCGVVHGGELGERKGVNLPGARLSIPSLTRKDRRDLAFALESGADFIAVSFVRDAADMRMARRAAGRGREAAFIAKIEKPEALENLSEILAESDGVMAARGDLGVEMPLEKVPLAQKEIIERARLFRLPSIVATQMLESMTQSPRPTRAEASDVANAVFDGADALMLSGETAAGRFPVEAAATMDRIIREAESGPRPRPPVGRAGGVSLAEAVAEAVTAAAGEIRLRCIAVFTETGRSARLLSQYRPPCPVAAFSPCPRARKRMALLWGVTPRPIREVRDIDELTAAAQARLLAEGLAARGDSVAIVAGTPMGLRGATNLMKLHVIGQPTCTRAGR